MFATVSVYIRIIKADTGKRVSFNYANSIVAVSSINAFTDTCKITVPRKVAYKGKPITDFIRRNDKITVWAGWDPDSNMIFDGYITQVGTGTPIVIECENNAWELKQIKITGRIYDKLNLRSFCNEWMPNYDVQIADIELGEVKINGETNLSAVFDYFIKNYPLRFFFRDGVFYGVLNNALMLRNNAVKTIKYKKGDKGNIASDSLVYTIKEDVKIQIVAKAILKDNTKLEWKEPATLTDCDVRTFLVPGATSLDELKTFALATLETFRIDKMTGDFTALGRPFCRKGDIVHLFDDQATERNNKRFIVEAVEYSVTTGAGFKQKITLGGELV
jgi:hypothetical protein